jgi:hypothetical protein
MTLKVMMICMVLFSLVAVCSGEPVSVPIDHSGRQVEAVALMKKHCTTCHTESRILDSLQALHRGQHDSYEQSVRSIVVKKIRLTGGAISHRDGKKILEYLVSLYG